MNEHQIVRLPNESVEYFEKSPLLMSMWALGKGVDSDIEVWQEDLERLRADGIDTIVFSQDDWDFLPQQGDQGVKDIQILARLKEAFGEPWYRDEKAAFFHLPVTGKEGVPPTALDIFPPIPAKGEMPANPGGTIRDPERSRPGGGSCGQDDDGFLPEGPPVQDVEGNRSGGGQGRKRWRRQRSRPPRSPLLTLLHGIRASPTVPRIRWSPGPSSDLEPFARNTKWAFNGSECSRYSLKIRTEHRPCSAACNSCRPPRPRRGGSKTITKGTLHCEPTEPMPMRFEHPLEPKVTWTNPHHSNQVDTTNRPHPRQAPIAPSPSNLAGWATPIPSGPLQDAPQSSLSPGKANLLHAL